MNKTSDFALLTMIVLVYSTVCMETDIYVPAFPDMRAFFGVSDEKIQQVLSLNFVGICLGSLLFGPLSDSFGRKKTIQMGLGLFAVTSWGCVFFNNFDIFLFTRFFQGLGAAAPMVIAFAIILDKFDSSKAAQMCGVLNIFITGVMASAPIFGSILTIYFGWKSNFLLIAVLSTISFFGSFYFIPETLLLKDRTPFSLKQITKDYKRVTKSFPYMAGTTICFLLFAGLVVFIANLSLIFIEYLGVSRNYYGFYQATAMFSFALFSYVSVKVIGRFGMDITKKIGILAVSCGALALLIIAYIYPDPVLICGCMVVFSAGIAFAGPIYSIEAANALPQLRGVSAGMNNAMRHMIIAGVVAIGSLIFNGSILPVALLIAFTTLGALLLIVALKSQSLKSAQVEQ